MDALVEPAAPDVPGHDACGVGFVPAVRGGWRRDVVACGLSALERLTHRGAPAALGAVDGCGVLTAIPWDILPAGCAPGATAVGMCFVRADEIAAVKALVAGEL